MKKFTKKMLAVIITIGSILNMVGCSEVKSEKSNVKDSSKTVTMKMTWWGNDKRKNLTEQVIKLFEQKNPNIKIEIESFSTTDEVRKNLIFNTADENMPDIIQTNIDFIHKFSKRNLLEDLNLYVNQKGLNISDIEPSYMEAGKREGGLYGVPMGINATVVALNPTIFQKAGVQIPTDSYSYDDLYNILKILKAKINEPDFYPLDSFFDFNSFIRSTGGAYFNSQGTSLGYEDDKVYTDYFNIQKKWMEEGLIAPDTATKGRLDKEALIVKWKAALAPVQSNQVAPLSRYSNTVLQMIALPVAVKGKEASFIKPSMFLSVSAYSEHKKEAIDFINFITNDLEANNILMGDRGVPASDKVREDIMKKLSQEEKQQYLLVDYMRNHSSVIDPPPPQFINGVNSFFTVLSGKINDEIIRPEDAAKQFRSETNKILGGGKGE